MAFIDNNIVFLFAIMFTSFLLLLFNAASQNTSFVDKYAKIFASSLV
ncbi:MAG: hypothetical protein Q8S84_08500 [bacterium]|nr:hypothetical protein [bacterium]MDP3381473.1 hypothetical protein [bacterium]